MRHISFNLQEYLPCLAKPTFHALVGLVLLNIAARAAGSLRCIFDLWVLGRGFSLGSESSSGGGAASGTFEKWEARKSELRARRTRG